MILEKYLKFSRTSIYAEDTNITIASNDVLKLVEDAHQELSNLAEWMRVNKRNINPKKTKFMVIGHPLKTENLDLPEVLKLNNSDIKRGDMTKSRGVIIIIIIIVIIIIIILSCLVLSFPVRPLRGLG